MQLSPHGPPMRVMLALLASIIAANGCSPRKYRLQADREAYHVIAERNDDPRWLTDDYSIDIDPRSRYFDPFDPDCSPMPPDDPASHQYVHLVDGKEGWKYWHCNGDRTELENPAWREALAGYVEISEDGSVELDIDSALRLAYVHSPSHQTQLETLYLSALDVTAERFRLDTQFFGGYDARYAHNGSLIPAGLGFVPALGRFVVNPPISGPGVENNRLTAGRPFAGDPALQAKRRFATAGEVLVGFANSFVFEFTDGDANLATSLANFSFIQPLLRGAGRDVALEQLTVAERGLLANLRAYSQYRQGFHTQVAIGELGVAGPRRGAGTTNVTVFSGQGSVGGYVGLLQQLQRIRNTEDSLDLQLRTFSRLRAYLAAGAIDRVQVDQFDQSIQSERATLLQNEDAFQLALDRYKTGPLGLPPDLPIELDESLIRQFQLVARSATAIQDSIAELQDRVGKIAELLDLRGKIDDLRARAGELSDDADVEPIGLLLTDVFRLIERIRRQLDDVRADLARMEEAPAGEQTMTELERKLIQLVSEELRGGSADLLQRFEEAKAKLTTLQVGLSEETKDATVRDNVVWLSDLIRLVEGCILVQERVHLEPIGPVLTDIFQFVEPVRRQLDDTQADLISMEEAAAGRERTMPDMERKEFQSDRERLHQELAEQQQQFDEARAELDELRQGLSQRTEGATARKTVVWLSKFYRLLQVSILVQARARLESVTVETIELSSQDAFEIAIANRLDFMNARAALADRWRLIQFNADALQSVLNVTAGGDLRTARNNPVSFRAPTGSLRLGLEFDAPFTRVLERNNYRQSLIDYQQSRRDFIKSRDSLHLGLRELLRQIAQRRTNLEIQRRAVAIAIRRVDMTRAMLYAPVPPPQPGQRPLQFGPTAAQNLLTAQNSLRDTQNNFMSVWLTYFAARMRLARELGVMKLDQDGTWIDDPLPGSSRGDSLDGDRSAWRELFEPPAVPTEWIEQVDSTLPLPNGPPLAEIDEPVHVPAPPPPPVG